MSKASFEPILLGSQTNRFAATAVYAANQAISLHTEVKYKTKCGVNTYFFELQDPVLTLWIVTQVSKASFEPILLGSQTNRFAATAVYAANRAISLHTEVKYKTKCGVNTYFFELQDPVLTLWIVSQVSKASFELIILGTLTNLFSRNSCLSSKDGTDVHNLWVNTHSFKFGKDFWLQNAFSNRICKEIPGFCFYFIVFSSFK